MLFAEYPYLNFSDYNLDWCIKTVKGMVAIVDTLDEWKAEHEKEYQELKGLYDDILAGRFPDAMIAAMYRWTVTNAVSVIGEAIKMVFFGLTDDGYFVAYIPDSWEEILFSTSGYDDMIATVDYGHLILNY